MAEGLRRRIALGAVLGAVNLGLAAVVTLVCTPLYLGLLKESGYGLNSVFQAVFAVLNLLSLGAQEATLYFAARDKSEAHVRVLARWHMTASCLGGLGLALSWTWSLGAKLGLKGAELEQFESALRPAALLWAAQFFCQWLWILCRARLRLTLQALHQGALILCVPVAALVALYGGGGFNAFLWGQALVWALGCLTLAPFLFRPAAGPPLAQGGEWRQVLGYSRWTFLFYLSFVALQSADRFFVVPLGAAAVAAYAIAASIFQRGVSALGLLPTLLVPAVSKLSSEQEHERAFRAYSLCLRLCAVLSLAFFIPLAALGHPFLSAWLDAKSPGIAERTYAVLVIFCVAGVFASLSAVVHSVLLGLGKAALVGSSAALGAALGLACAWWGVRSLGMEGAAIGALVGYGFLYLFRMLASELKIFKRPLMPLVSEHLLMLACALAAYLALSMLAGPMAGRSLAVQMAGLAATALALLGLGLGADAVLAWRRGRASVGGTLLEIVKRGH